MKSNAGQPPDIVYHNGSFSSVLKLTEALDAVGYKGTQANGVGYDPRLVGATALNNTYTILQWAPTEASNVPAIEQLKADFAKYAPGSVIGLPQMAGYWSADFFLEALQKAGRNVTVDGLVKTINGGFSYYHAGAVPEARFPLLHTQSTPCEVTTHLIDKHYEPVGPLACGTLLKK
jgi:ABC-type branched-subunit amino acid transport system substrate-binding protein